MKLSDLNPNPANPRKIDPWHLDALKKSLEKFGDLSGIVFNKRTGRLVGGHQRIKVLPPDSEILMTSDDRGHVKVGENTYTYREVDWDEQDEIAANIAANKQGGEWDQPKLNEWLLELDSANYDMELVGFSPFELEQTLVPIHNFEPQSDEDSVPEKVEPKTKPGDLYQLGRHRLLCGDSTNIQHVEKLMGGEKADLWLTDPPYGVSYRSNGAEDKHEAIENDDMPLNKMAEFWETVASNAWMVCSDKAPYYWFACQGGDQMMMMMSIGRANWKVRHELIWVKDSLVMGRCDYHYKHEPILYGWKTKGTHAWYSDRKQTSVLEFPRPKKSEEHPTMKPVDLVKYLMGNSSKHGDIILDTFGGSGTTLIAAESTNRSARLIEISPTYCDVIVARWEKYTGKKAELVEPIPNQ